MNDFFVFLAMVFCHIIDDYCLQGILAMMKQKEWWKKQEHYCDKYKDDYLVALFMHAFSWTFMVMLPIAIAKEFNVGIGFYIMFFVNVFIHLYVDDLKANQYKINLWQDQSIHLLQLSITCGLLI